MADVVKWKDKYQSLRSRMTKAANRGKELGLKGALVTGEAVLSGAGGALSGELMSRYPTLRGQDLITVSTLVGAATTLGGAIMSVTAKDKDAVIAGAMTGALGQGMLAGDLAVKRFLAAQKAKGAR